MTTSNTPIPEGFHTVTPSIVCRDAAKAIEFYKTALGAEERMRMNSPDGKVMHSELRIGNSVIFVTDEFPDMGTGCAMKSPQTLGASTASLNIYVEDVDTAFATAVSHGVKVTMPVSDMFWGDRFGSFTDPFGHTWSISTHKEDLTQHEIEERAQSFFASMKEMMAQKKTA